MDELLQTVLILALTDVLFCVPFSCSAEAGTFVSFIAVTIRIWIGQTGQRLVIKRASCIQKILLD